MRRPLLATPLLCALSVALAVPTAAAQTPTTLQGTASGRLGTWTATLDASSSAWRLHMRYAEPLQAARLDLDLYGFQSDSGILGEVLCSSEGTGSEEMALCVVPEGSSLEVAVRRLNRFGRADFTVTATPLDGPLLEGEALVAGMAGSLPELAATMKAEGAYELEGELLTTYFEEPTAELDFAKLYALTRAELPAGPLTLSIESGPNQEEAPLDLRVFDADGTKVAEATGELGRTALSEDWGDTIYVLITAEEWWGYLERWSFTLALEAGASSPRIQSSRLPYDSAGTGTRSFRLQVDEQPVVVAVEGAMPTATGEFAHQALEVSGGAQHLVVVGTPREGMPHLFDAPLTSGELPITVAGRTDGPYADRPWQIAVRSTDGFAPVLVPFDAVAAHDWPEDMAFGQVEGHPIANGVAVFRLLGSAWDGVEGDLSARLSTESVGQFHLAVANRYGQIYDISDQSVRWSWAQTEGLVYLLAIPVGGQAGDTAKVEVYPSFGQRD